MKKHNEALFILIERLSPSEKRYFNLYASRHVLNDKNNYLKLFELIVKNQIKSDEELFKLKEFGLYVNNYAVHKVQLFNQILASLRAYRGEQTILSKIKSLILNFEILIEKNLLGKADKAIQKALILAREYEYFTLESEILALQMQLVAKLYYKKMSVNEFKIIKKQAKLALQKQKNLLDYMALYHSIYTLHFQKIGIKSKDESDMHKLFENSLLNDISKCLSNKAKTIFWQLHALKAFMTRNTKEAYKINEQLLKLFSANKAILVLNKSVYLSVYRNYLIDCLQLGKTQQLFAEVEVLNNLMESKLFKGEPQMQVDTFRFLMQLQLNYFISNGLFNKGVLLINENKKKIESSADKMGIHNYFIIKYLELYCSFAEEDYSHCIDLAQIYFGKTSEQIVEELRAAATIILVLSHYHSGNELLLESMLLNIKRYQQRRKQYFELEALFFSLMNKLIYAAETERIALIQNFKQQLDSLGSKSETKLMNNFNFAVWADALLNKRTFSEQYRWQLK